MNKSKVLQLEQKIEENIDEIMSRIEENPMLEHYNVRNLESYLRSLEILGRIKGNGT